MALDTSRSNHREKTKHIQIISLSPLEVNAEAFSITFVTLDKCTSGTNFPDPNMC